MNKTEKALRALIIEIEKGCDINLSTVTLGEVEYIPSLKHLAYGLQKLKQELDKE